MILAENLTRCRAEQAKRLIPTDWIITANAPNRARGTPDGCRRVGGKAIAAVGAGTGDSLTPSLGRAYQ
jgi:hypothetical protein